VKAIFSLTYKMATWQLCKSIFGFWADGDTYENNGTRNVKFDTAVNNIPTEVNGCTIVGNIFWRANINTMDTGQDFMLHFIN
jgi:hypothetical protein